MTQTQKEIGYINAIPIVFNGQHLRVDEHLEAVLKNFVWGHFLYRTRMYSSRMRTVRNRSRLRGGLSGPGGCTLSGGCTWSWGCTWSGGVPGLGGVPGPSGVYLVWGCTWSQGVYLVPGGTWSRGVCTWSRGVLHLGTPPCGQKHV